MTSARGIAGLVAQHRVHAAGHDPEVGELAGAADPRRVGGDELQRAARLERVDEAADLVDGGGQTAGFGLQHGEHVLAGRVGRRVERRVEPCLGAVGDLVGELGDLFDLEFVAQLCDAGPERLVLAHRPEAFLGVSHVLVAVDREVPAHLAAGDLPAADQVDAVALHGGHDDLRVEVDEQVEGGVGDRLDAVTNFHEQGHADLPVW